MRLEKIPEPRKVAVCEGKTSHRSWEQAEAVRRRRVRSRGKVHDSALHVYRCPLCRGFHLGTTLS